MMLDLTCRIPALEYGGIVDDGEDEDEDVKVQVVVPSASLANSIDLYKRSPCVNTNIFDPLQQRVQVPTSPPISVRAWTHKHAHIHNALLKRLVL